MPGGDFHDIRMEVVVDLLGITLPTQGTTASDAEDEDDTERPTLGGAYGARVQASAENRLWQHPLAHAAALAEANLDRAVSGRPWGYRPALTTLLTILDRMYRAGELDRVRRTTGEYEFSVARREASAAAEAMIDSLLAARDRSTALLSFAGSLSPDDVETLKRALERKPSRRAP